MVTDFVTMSFEEVNAGKPRMPESTTAVRNGYISVCRRSARGCYLPALIYCGMVLKFRQIWSSRHRPTWGPASSPRERDWKSPI